jgi:uncharacterized cupredoxin-like copper-binding protein
MLVLVVVIVALTACAGAEEQPSASGGEGSEPSTTEGAGSESSSGAMDGDAMDDHGGAEDGDFAFGRPADASEADRAIEIHTDNELAFDPAEVTVAAGEVVTFSITNDGDLPHDFVIGDDAAQEAHAAEMAEMDDEMTEEGEEHGDANAVSVPAGETIELTWAFDGETEGLLYACHEPGHYDAGMIGEIIVES